MPQQLSITAATAEPALLDLPWHLPLEDWPSENIAALPKGLSRHTVRFAHLNDHVIAIKETLFDLAKREYEMLRKLEKLDVPCVDSKEQPESSKSIKPSCLLVLICSACNMMCSAVLLMRLHNELYS